MKEVALLGMESHVFADVLSELLHRNISVNAFVPNPERLMIDNVDLTVSLLDVEKPSALSESLEGYHDAIIAFSDNQTDVKANDFALKYYLPMLKAAREAGVNRVIVVGSPESAAYFTADLRRQDDIDWVFISTEGAFAARVADESVAPRHHHEVYAE